jgi:PhzF family phenazine biosynthesis protein
MRRRFRQVDVFTAVPYRGNPVAVVLDGEGLSTEEMQRLAQWTNLSETTFLLPPTSPGADYRVRIFTPARELPFAGHPTIGTCHAWLEAGGVPAGDGPVQECGAGLVSLRRDGGRLAFAAPPLVRSGAVEEGLVVRIAGVLRIDRSEIVDAEWVDNGPGWVGVLLADAGAVLALRPGDVGALDVGVVGLHPGGPDDAAADDAPAVEVRAFFPVEGGSTREDPVTGSLNASLAPWLVRTGRVRLPYTARQGTAVGRDGRVYLAGDVSGDGPLWVGGDAVTCVDGHIEA